MHQSIATISSPEFINLQPLDKNPLMSACEIKVLYVGENRNHSFITKEVATEMSKTLRGAPIVGYYKEDKGDFADHGERVIMDDEGIKFECLTKPYGFVAPDAKVWFQKFEDYDDFGNAIEREYLMTTGYLWTGQFPEAAEALSGKPQSMELDEKSLDGHWSTNVKNNMDFFIINDAIFSKLCILGDDVEPCFEGASIGTPEVSKSFTLDDDFKNTLYSMIQDLKDFVSRGGQQMEEEKVELIDQDNIDEIDFTENQEEIEESSIVESEVEPEAEFEAEEEAEVSEEVEEEVEVEEEDAESEPSEEVEPAEEFAEVTEEEDNVSEQFALLQSEYETLQSKYAELESKYAELVEFKNQIEDKDKLDLIESFYMLDDEDKREVRENRANYSKDEIEAKLSVICVRKKVNFDIEEPSTTKEEPVLVNIETEQNIPAWVSALKNARKQNS